MSATRIVVIIVAVAVVVGGLASALLWQHGRAMFYPEKDLFPENVALADGLICSKWTANNGMETKVAAFALEGTVAEPGPLTAALPDKLVPTGWVRTEDGAGSPVNDLWALLRVADPEGCSDTPVPAFDQGGPRFETLLVPEGADPDDCRSGKCAALVVFPEADLAVYVRVD